MPHNYPYLYKKPPEVVEQDGGSGDLYKPSQPSQRHPFKPTSPPRVDNKNQPWYGGSRSAMAGADTSQTVDVTTQDSSGAQKYWLSDVWDAFAKIWGGNNPKANLQAPPDATTAVGSDQEGSEY